MTAAASVSASASAAVIAIAVTLLIGAMFPGASFVVVARNAIGRSRADGVATALGMGVGGLVFGAFALAGLYTLLVAVEWLHAGLKAAGGLYLLYLATRIWRGAATATTIEAGHADVKPHSVRSSFRLGLTTQLSNPKTAIWYGSIFASLLPPHPPAWYYVALPPLVFTVETGWYTLVALGFSSRRPHRAYQRAKRRIDRTAAGAIVVLGLQLVLTARRSGL